jgi:hypothetical protein
MPGGSGGSLDTMSTPVLCAWLLVTLFGLGGVSWKAIVAPTPIYARIFLGIIDVFFLFAWLVAGSILYERFRRYRRRA